MKIVFNSSSCLLLFTAKERARGPHKAAHSCLQTIIVSDDVVFVTQRYLEKLTDYVRHEIRMAVVSVRNILTQAATMFSMNCSVVTELVVTDCYVSKYSFLNKPSTTTQYYRIVYRLFS